MRTLIVLLVVIATISCSATGQQTKGTSSPKPGPAPATKPDGAEKNRLYSAWASFKAATETDYELAVTKGGIVTKLPLHYVLAEANAARPYCNSTFRLAGVS